MGRRVVSGGCHLAERKNGDFAALRRLSPDEEELDGGGRVSRSFILSNFSSNAPRISFSRVYDHSLPHSRLATGDWISSFSCRQISTIRMMSHTLHVYSSFSGLSLYPLILQQVFSIHDFRQ
ncbi:unnamed protein product [Spirodela intermedia]|uniref:Uncharacterized protein n=1 Tax=Spirodela intermedia TaxID=51605 RepID=A0ABN7ECP3_SPIIN|nr:unnamed protein product [Spirodela intermedia]